MKIVYLLPIFFSLTLAACLNNSHSRETYSNAVLVRMSCVDSKLNLCSTYELTPDVVADKKKECVAKGQVWSEFACIMEGTYTGCRQTIGSIHGQTLTWTLFDPKSGIDRKSCEKDGGTFVKGS